MKYRPCFSLVVLTLGLFAVAPCMGQVLGKSDFRITDGKLYRGSTACMLNAIEVPDLMQPGASSDATIQALDRMAEVGVNCVCFNLGGFSNDGATLWARGFICVERESQQGILVGRGGERIKSIVRDAQRELAEIFPWDVKLDIRVKVDRDWRKRDPLLKKMIR